MGKFWNVVPLYDSVLVVAKTGNPSPITVHVGLWLAQT
jgi:hypothetical protein